MKEHSITLTSTQIQDIITASLYLASRLDTAIADDHALLVRLLDVNDHLWESSQDSSTGMVNA
jgi:hypothetical protein